MVIRGRLRQIGLWGAMLAVLLMVFGSTPARVHSKRGNWVEVCTRHGRVMIDLSAQRGPASPVSPAPASHDDHCSHCVLPHVPPMPVAQYVAALPVSAQYEPFLFFSAPRPLFIWAAASPRGPPQFD